MDGMRASKRPLMWRLEKDWHGEMDADDETMIRAWIKIHREELFANWKLLTEEGTYFKIEPLR